MIDTALDAPFFSIILPVFNGEKFISDTIQSILQQFFTAWELIIIDDGSTDKTADIVTNFCNLDPRIKLLQQCNKKQPAARNTGLKIASGQWIAFIDADDLWLPAKLERQYQCIKKNDDLDVVFSDGYTKYHDKRIRHYYHYEIVHGFFTGTDLYKKMLFGNYIPILSAVVKRNWVLRIGMQDETVPGVEDHDYWLRLCKAGANFYGMEERLFVYNIHASNFSADTLKQNYISAIIRIKNFDPLLLNNKEIKKFKKSITQYLKVFQQQGKTEWVEDLKERYSKLNIPPIPIVEQLGGKFYILIKTIQIFLDVCVQKCKRFLLKVLYFYPKSIFEKNKDRLAIFYTNWLYASNIVKPGSIHISSTARINFFNKNSKLDVQSIYIGDYSIINFMQETSNIIAGDDVSISKFCNFNIVGQLVLGNNVLFNNHSTLTCHEEIVIGDNSWFGEGVKLYDHSHNYKERNIPFTQQGYSHGKIEIGSNVWVGSNTIILQNVTIGDGCVIGANNVVYKSLPPNTLVKSKSMEIIDTIK